MSTTSNPVSQTTSGAATSGAASSACSEPATGSNGRPLDPSGKSTEIDTAGPNGRNRLGDAWWWLCKVWSAGVFAPVYNFRSIGAEHLPLDGPALIACNHQSYLDVVMLGVASPRPVSYVARAGLFRSPALAWLIRSLNAFPLSEDGNPLAAIRETLRRLQEGKLVVLFPEGGRTNDGLLQSPKPGIGLLLRKSRVPVVPTAITGAWDAWPPTKLTPRFGSALVEFGRPIAPDAWRGKNDETISTIIHDEIATVLERACARRRFARGCACASPPR